MENKDPLSMRGPNDLPMGLKHVGVGLGANGTPLTNVAAAIGQVGLSPSTPLSTAIGGGLGGRYLSEIGRYIHTWTKALRINAHPCQLFYSHNLL